MGWTFTLRFARTKRLSLASALDDATLVSPPPVVFIFFTLMAVNAILLTKRTCSNAVIVDTSTVWDHDVVGSLYIKVQVLSDILDTHDTVASNIDVTNSSKITKSSNGV